MDLRHTIKLVHNLLIENVQDLDWDRIKEYAELFDIKNIKRKKMTGKYFKL